MKHVQHYLEFVLYKTGILLLGILSLPTLWGIGKLIGWLNYYFIRVRRSVIHDQLLLIYPDWNSDQRHQFILCYLQRQFFIFLDFIKMMHFNTAKLKKRINNDRQNRKWRAQFKNDRLVFIAGHFANFLMGTLYVHSVIRPIAGIAKRQSNHLIHRDFYHTIAKEGMIILENRRDLKRISRLDFPKNYSLGILIDQDAGRKGQMVPFMGYPASTSKGAAYLITRFHLRPITVGMHLEKNLNYQLDLEDMGCLDSHPPSEILLSLNDHLSAYIRRYPMDWLWLHRRWKTQR